MIPLKTPYFVEGNDIVHGQFLGNSRNFKLSTAIIFTSAKYWNPTRDDYTWRIPFSETFDGASIPKLLWSLVGAPFSGKYRLSAAVHDYYCKEGQLIGSPVNCEIPYYIVHELFAEMIAVEGVTGWRLKAMARAVKMGGPRW